MRRASKAQSPRFRHKPGPAPAVVPLLSDQLEARLLVDAAGGLQLALRPENDPAVAAVARKSDALSDEAPANPEPARGRLDEQQAQLRDRCGLLDEKDGTDRFATPLGNPAAFTPRLEVLHEFGDDSRDQRLEALVVPPLLRIEEAVP